jgi:hypothetical protein
MGMATKTMNKNSSKTSTTHNSPVGGVPTFATARGPVCDCGAQSDRPDDEIIWCVADIARHYNRSVRWVQAKKAAGHLPASLPIDRNRWLKIAVVGADATPVARVETTSPSTSERLSNKAGLFDEKGRTKRPSQRGRGARRG